MTDISFSCFEQESRKTKKIIRKYFNFITILDINKVEHLELGFGVLTEPPDELKKFPRLWRLSFHDNKINRIDKLLELENLRHLNLWGNQLNHVNGLEKLTKLETLILQQNPNLTKTQIDNLQKALPNCNIIHDAK